MPKTYIVTICYTYPPSMDNRITLKSLYIKSLIIVALAEFMIMFLLWYARIPEGLPSFLIDTSLLTLIIAPFLYFLNIRLIDARLQIPLEREAVLNKILNISLQDIDIDTAMETIFDHTNTYRWKSVRKVGGIWLLDGSGQLVLKAPKSLKGPQKIVGCNYELCKRALESGFPAVSTEGVDCCVPIKCQEKRLGCIKVFLKDGAIKNKGEEDFLTSISDIVASIVCFRYMQRSLQESEDRFCKITSATQDAIIMMDENGKISHWNPAAESIFGYSKTEALGQDLHLLIGFEDCHSSFNKHFDAFKKTGTGNVIGKTLDLFAKRKDGTEVPIELSVSAVNIGGKWQSIGIIRDITERKRYEDQIVYMAYHDPLTGLPNRSLLKDRLEQAIAMGRRHQLRVAVLFLDLCHFKYINDTLGHRTGDNLLKEIAVRLRGCLRASDTIARLSGDEFTIIIQDIKRIKDIIKVINKLFATMERPFSADGHEFYVTVSVGISIFPDDGEDVEILLQSADIAMYRAKSEGSGNTYHFFSPELQKAPLDRLKAESSLRRALDREEFILYFQPQVSISTGKITGIEALLRWNDPERGIVFPKEFIPVAEESGLIIQIGEWVISQACTVRKRWEVMNIRPLYMAVNLSMRQFRQKNLISSIKKKIKESAMDPHYLELELTESIIMDNAEETIQILYDLKKLGIRLSIDDFGTGYSSLWYLKRMPLDTLKIAQPFVHDLATNPDARAIATAIIKLAHTLKLEVIAEGVETEDQLNILRELQCDKIQGYLVARPMPAEKMELFLKRCLPVLKE